MSAGAPIDVQGLLEALQQQGGPTPPPPDGSAAGGAPEPPVDTSGQGMGVQLPPGPPTPMASGVAAGQPIPPMPQSPGQVGGDRKGQIRELLGNFLFALGRGLSASAAARPGYGSVAGLGGALEAGPELQMMKQQRQAQLAMQQSEMAHRQALEKIAYSKIAEQQAARESKESIEANKLKAQQAVNEARVGELNAAAGKARYMSTPVGIFDTTVDPATGKPKGYVAGSYNQPIPVTPELKQMHPGVFDTIPDGEVLSPSVIASFVRAGVFSTVPVMTGEGIVPFSRTTGTAGPPIPATPPGVSAAVAGKAATPTVIVTNTPEGPVPSLTTAGQAMRSGAMPASGVAPSQKLAGVGGSFGELRQNLDDTVAGLQKLPPGTKLSGKLAPSAMLSENNLVRALGNMGADENQQQLAFAIRRLREGVLQARQVMGNGPLRSDAQVQLMIKQLPDATAISTLDRDALLRQVAGFTRIVDRYQQQYGKLLQGQGGTGGEKRVGVIGPDGKRGTIPASQLPAAINQGYKRAQ